MLSDNPKICAPPSLSRGRACGLPRWWSLGLVATAVLVQFGCASQISRREVETGYGTSTQGAQGGSWEAVLPSPDVHERERFEDPRDLPEFARADSRLSAVSDAAVLASSDWPDLDRASLDNPRYLQIRDRDGRYTYFSNDRNDYRRYYHPRWHGVRD